MTESKKTQNLYDRLNEARKTIQSMDWSFDDHYNISANKTVFFVSTGKLKKQIDQALAGSGLEMTVRYSDLQSNVVMGTIHWIVKLEAAIYSSDDPSVCDISYAYGEGVDQGDKGVSKAHTYALRNWLLNKFMIAGEPDNQDSAPGTFSRSEDTPEVRSKIAALGVKPTAPKTAPKVAPKAPAKPAEAPKEAPKAEEPKEEPKAAQSVLKTVAEEAPAGFVLEAPYKTPVNDIVDSFTKAAETGEVQVEEYNEMSMSRAEIKSNAEALAFITKYKTRVAQLKGARRWPRQSGSNRSAGSPSTAPS